MENYIHWLNISRSSQSFKTRGKSDKISEPLNEALEKILEVEVDVLILVIHPLDLFFLHWLCKSFSSRSLKTKGKSDKIYEPLKKILEVKVDGSVLVMIHTLDRK